MRPNYYIPSGLVSKKFDRKADHGQGLFSIDRWLKKLLLRLKVAFVDDCCPLPAADQTDLPVRFNKVANRLERYNPDTDLWVATT